MKLAVLQTENPLLSANRAVPAGRANAAVGAVIAVLLVVDSLHFIFARALEPRLPPLTAAFFVMAIAALEVALFALWRGRNVLAVLRRRLWFFLAIGLLVAGSTGINYVAVHTIDPGTASMLAQTSTVFALALGLLWLRESLTWLEGMGGLICVAGALIISFQASSLLRLGSLLVLAGSAMYALHATLVKRYGGDLEFVSFFLFRLLSTASFLLLFAAGSGSLVWPQGSDWAILLLAGSVDIVISRVLYYQALRRMRLGLHAVMLTLSPVVTILWSRLLFDAVPTPQALLGGLVVIGGIILVSLGRGRAA